MTIAVDIQNANLIADLKAMPVSPSTKVFVFGKDTIGDNLGGFYYWDNASTLPEDSVYLNVITSDNTPTGRWRRVFAKSVQYPQGVLVNTGGVKKFYAAGVINASGECALNLTADNTPNGAPLFAEIWKNDSRAKTTATTPSQAVSSYTKSETLKTTTHGYFRANPVTITLGLAYAPFASAPPGTPVQFEITGV